jgi:hypothetical protein
VYPLTTDVIIVVAIVVHIGGETHKGLVEYLRRDGTREKAGRSEGRRVRKPLYP